MIRIIRKMLYGKLGVMAGVGFERPCLVCPMLDFDTLNRSRKCLKLLIEYADSVRLAPRRLAATCATWMAMRGISSAALATGQKGRKQFVAFSLAIRADRRIFAPDEREEAAIAKLLDQPA